MFDKTGELPVELHLGKAIKVYAKRLGLFLLIVLANFALLGFILLLESANKAAVGSFMGIFIVAGIIFIFMGMTKYMFQLKAGPPPNGCGLAFSFLFSMVGTKQGRIGLVCIAVAGLLSLFLSH